MNRYTKLTPNAASKSDDEKISEILAGDTILDDIPQTKEVEETVETPVEERKEKKERKENRVVPRGRKKSPFENPVKLNVRMDSSLIDKVKKKAKKQNVTMTELAIGMSKEVLEMDTLPHNPYAADPKEFKGSTSFIFDLPDREKFALWCDAQGVSQSYVMEAMFEIYKNK